MMLTTEMLEACYRAGAFPMADDYGQIGFYRSDPRSVLEFDDLHVSRSLGRVLRKGTYEVRVDEDFEGVIRACAEREETWINAEIIEAYVRLHGAGKAHSVEAYSEGNLVGGLYGVSIGGVFFGESMFHEVTDASKVALHALILRMRERGYQLLDTQWTTEHLRTFGAYEIPRAKYLKLLRSAITLPCSFV